MPKTISKPIPVQRRSAARSPAGAKLWLAVAGLLFGCVSNASSDTDYHIHFKAHFTPDDGLAQVSIEVEQTDFALRLVDLAAPGSRYQLVAADGEVEQSETRIRWTPPADGGRLTYTASIDSRRGDDYDARLTQDWVLVRMGDLFPPARVRSSTGSTNTSTVSISGPEHWSFESRYGNLTTGSGDASGPRRYNRPTGWLVGGELGTRRTVINGRTITISGPKGHDIRRIDMLAFLRWTLPTMTRTFSDLPNQLLVVGAPSCMWRGGLSAPGSLYLHQDRPLISENGTSTLLHELAHIAGLSNAAADADWLVEGLAEYYALLTLKRSGGISQARFDRALEHLRSWAERDKGTLSSPSSGANTAAAVLELHAQAQRLQAAGSSIDELTRQLLQQERITVEGYRSILRRLHESNLD